MTGRPNILVLLSDEHGSKHLGCYGSKLARTPHLDALAARGVRFTQAYTPSPICVPARAALATGRSLHKAGFWCNADPYDGGVPSWHHLLRDAGHRVVSIGKLHFKGGGRDHGFSEEILPMHAADGLGDLLGLLRDEVVPRAGAAKLEAMAGPGESSYTRYDRRITAAAETWLREEAPKPADRPWVLFVSLVAPHFPLTAPAEFYSQHRLDALPMPMPMPKIYGSEERPGHPYLRHYAANLDYDRYFADPHSVRRAIAGYLGLVGFVDSNVGRVLGAIEASGQADRTVVLYASDHGDNLGARGVWGKSTMYEESADVPLILAGAGLPHGRRWDAPVSLIDVAPTLLELCGVSIPAEMEGRSLLSPDPAREVLSEYHATGSRHGAFMLRRGRWKLIHHEGGLPPELFDLDADPEEPTNLAADPTSSAVLPELYTALRRHCDPAAVDARARARQRALLAAAGGREAVLARGDFGFSPPPGESHAHAGSVAAATR